MSDANKESEADDAKEPEESLQESIVKFAFIGVAIWAAWKYLPTLMAGFGGKKRDE